MGIFLHFKGDMNVLLPVFQQVRYDFCLVRLINNAVNNPSLLAMCKRWFIFQDKLEIIQGLPQAVPWWKVITENAVEYEFLHLFSLQNLLVY